MAMIPCHDHGDHGRASLLVWQFNLGMDGKIGVVSWIWIKGIISSFV